MRTNGFAKGVLIFSLIALLMLVFAQPALSSDGIVLRAGSETGAAGEVVAIDINISNAEGTSRGYFTLFYLLSGGPLNVEFVNATQGNLVANAAGSQFAYDDNNGFITISWETPAMDTPDSGVIATLNFKLLEAGEVNLTFDEDYMVEAPPGRIISSPVNGKITITAAPSDDKQQAIKLADEAIAALPLIGDLELRHKPDVENARFLSGRAKTEHGAVDADFENLEKLVAAENRIKELEEMPEPKDKQHAIDLADEAIAALPLIGELELRHKPDVENARFLVGRAKTEHGAVDADFDNLEKLVAAEERINELEEEVDPEDKETAIKLADEAIAALPDVERLLLSDKPDVENARYLVSRAKTEHGAVDADFENLGKLVAAEERIIELEEEEAPAGGAWIYWVLGALVVVAIVVVVVVLTSKKRKKHQQKH